MRSRARPRGNVDSGPGSAPQASGGPPPGRRWGQQPLMTESAWERLCRCVRLRCGPPSPRSGLTRSSRGFGGTAFASRWLAQPSAFASWLAQRRGCPSTRGVQARSLRTSFASAKWTWPAMSEGAALRLAHCRSSAQGTTRLSRMACHERGSGATESSGAGGGNRTHTGGKPHGILRPPNAVVLSEAE